MPRGWSLRGFSRSIRPASSTTCTPQPGRADPAQPRHDLGRARFLPRFAGHRSPPPPSLPEVAWCITIANVRDNGVSVQTRAEHSGPTARRFRSRRVTRRRTRRARRRSASSTPGASAASPRGGSAAARSSRRSWGRRRGSALDASGAERALVGADAGVRIAVREVAIAALAIGAEVHVHGARVPGRTSPTLVRIATRSAPRSRRSPARLP